jgi:hypothetical protein
LTIFCEKIGVFLKSQCYDHLKKLVLFSVKNANFFAEFFAENIFKIITSVPGRSKKLRDTPKRMQRLILTKPSLFEMSVSEMSLLRNTLANLFPFRIVGEALVSLGHFLESI